MFKKYQDDAKKKIMYSLNPTDTVGFFLPDGVINAKRNRNKPF